MQIAPTFTAKNCHECKTLSIAAILYLSKKMPLSAMVQKWCKTSANCTRASALVQWCKRLICKALHYALMHREQQTNETN